MDGEAGARRAPAVPAPTRMPADLSISLEAGRGADRGLAELGPRRHPMRGFEDGYVDIVDWIVRITHRIWEDQDVGYIYDTYAPGCRVFDDGGPKYGVERVVAETVQSIHAFADVRHYADDVIWAGDEDEGFYTSHRAINVGHHTGAWRWGPATGRKVNLWVIANCVSRENEIFDEWVLYNTGARLAQLGIDVAAAARMAGNEEGFIPVGERELTEIDRLAGGRKPLPLERRAPAGGFDPDFEVRSLFHEVYNRRNLSAIDKSYGPNVRFHGASNRSGYGRADVRAMARGLLATFPDLGLQVDEVYWMGNEADGFRVSVRWSATGTHRGYALYGKPTGRRVYLWGLSQLYVQDGRIVEDWMLFNEFDVLMQLLRDDPPPFLAR
ncbi:MAG: ester cyclase [Actinomycetota bacterium]|nr:ester cyclase [Actinomycetota bacterium]